jgi:hypothetical protein
MSGDTNISFPTLNAGWNLIATSTQDDIKNQITKLNNENYKVDKLVTKINGSWKIYDPEYSFLQEFSQFDPNRGYWVKVQKGTSVETADGYQVDLYIDNENNDISDLVEEFPNLTADDLADRDYSKVSSIVIQTPEDETPSSYLEASAIPDYLFGKIKRDTLVTVDGYEVSIYAGKEFNTSSLGDISNLTLEELGNLDFTGVENLKVSVSTESGEVVSGELDLEDLENSIQEVRDGDYTPDYTSGTSIYIYSMSEGGSPSSVAKVSIFEYVDGSKGELLGVSTDRGFIYIKEIPENGQIVIEKYGFNSSIQTIKPTPGSANYFFISKDSAIGEFGNFVGYEDRNLDRSLEPILELEPPKFYSNTSYEKSSAGGVFVNARGLYFQNSKGMDVRTESVETLSDQYVINSLLHQTGYSTTVIGQLAVNGFENLDPVYNRTFEDLMIKQLRPGTGDFSDIEGILIVDLSKDLELAIEYKEDHSAEALEKIKGTDENGTSDGIELYVYKEINGDLTWHRVDRSNFSLNHKSQISSKYLSEYFTEENKRDELFIKINSSIYNGPYSMFAFYKKVDNEQVDIDGEEYSFNVKVIDTDTKEPLPNTFVKFERGNGLSYISETTNENGAVTFKLLVADGGNDNFTVTAIEGKHYPVEKTFSIANLEKNTSVVFELKRPATFGTVKGRIWNSAGGDVPEAQVQLVAPMALADVKKDVKRVIGTKEVEGIQVGGLVGATYTWFIKKHKDDFSEDGLNRVSEERWLEIKKGTVKNDADFLSYEEILNFTIQASKESDPSDVKIYVAGQFDISIQVEHDVDGDGVTDYIELAKSDAITGNEVFIDNPTVSYNHLGFISAEIDLEKFYKKTVREYERSKKVWYYRIDDGEWHGVANRGENDETKDELINLGLVAPVYQSDWDTFLQDAVKVSGNKEFGYVFVEDGNLDDDTYKIEAIQWNMGIVSDIYLDDDSFTTIYLENGLDGTLSWKVLSDEAPILNYAKEIDDKNSTVVFTSDKKKLPLKHVAKTISSNRFLEQLALPMGEVVSNPYDATTSVIDDGFRLVLGATIFAKFEDGRKLEMRNSGHLVIDPYELKLKDFIEITDVFVSKPTTTPAVQIETADRVGLYEFSPVDMSLSQIREDNQNSLLRVSASKSGFYKSPMINVKRFEIDNTETSEREDIARIDIEISEKPTYKINVRVEDLDGNGITDAEVSVDGIKTPKNISEKESVVTRHGKNTTFNNVLGGKGSHRIVRVSVPDSNYIGEIKVLQNFSSDRNLIFRLDNTDDVPDHLASISFREAIVSYGQKYQAKVTAQIFDLTDKDTDVRSLTKSQVSIRVNGKKVQGETVVSQNDETEYTFFLPLEVGENDIEVEVSNRLGNSKSKTLHLSYNPKVGNVAGDIRGGKHEESIYFVEIFDDKGRYINTLTAYQDEEEDRVVYVFENLEAKKTYQFQAVQVDMLGRVLAISNMTKMTVPVAETNMLDLTLLSVQSESEISGSPLFDEVSLIKQSDVNATTGTIKLNATISNFDRDGADNILGTSDDGSIGFIVNDMAQFINLETLTKVPDTDFTYALTNYKVQLVEGVNNVYVSAVNPDGSYDWTKDFTVVWTPEGVTLHDVIFNLNGCETDGSCSTIGNIFVSIFDISGHLLETKETDANGQVIFSNLVEGMYTIQPDPALFDYYTAQAFELLVNSSGETEGNLSTFSNSVDFTDEYQFSDFYIEDIDFNVSTTTYGEWITATAFLSVEDTTGYTFYWSYIDVNGLEKTFYGEEISFEVLALENMTLHLEVSNGDVTETMEADIYVDIPQCEVTAIWSYESMICETIVCEAGYIINQETGECEEGNNRAIMPPEVPQFSN